MHACTGRTAAMAAMAATLSGPRPRRGGRPTLSSARPPCHARPGPPRAGPPSFNPQNTPEPLATPDPALSAPEAVAAQVTALAADDTPWPGHGVQCAYGFARDTGDLELST